MANKVKLVDYYTPIVAKDQHGNEYICLSKYEANAIMRLLENLEKERKPGFDTGDWFHDLPPKIRKWLDAKA